MFKILRNQSGMALLITLTFIALAVTGTVELNRRVRVSVLQTGTVKQDFTLSCLAESALNAGMLILAKDKFESKTDSLIENWANPEKINAALKEIIYDDKTDISLVIEDELSRVQVNALVDFPAKHNFNSLQRNIWINLISHVKSIHDLFEDLEPVSLVNAAKDWIDSGDDDAITGLTGAESDYYKHLEFPYLCANDQFRSIGDLVLVKGFSHELVYGIKDKPGLTDYMTVFGIQEGGAGFIYKGKININTAALPVIAAILPQERKEAAELIYDFRDTLIKEKNIPAMSSLQWYKDAPGCKDIVINPKIITVSTDLFRIKASAEIDKTKQILVAVVKREKDKNTGVWKCIVLSKWRE